MNIGVVRIKGSIFGSSLKDQRYCKDQNSDPLLLS